MKATKKPTPAQQIKDLKAWKRSAIKSLNMLDGQAIGAELGLSLGTQVIPNILPGIKRLKSEIEQLRIRLVEARRRTLPFADGRAEVNFLPLCITQVEFARDIKHLSYAGVHGTAASKAKFTLTVLADSEDPPQVNPIRNPQNLAFLDLKKGAQR